jgi:two-component system, cell cycle sensor histidine kinase and response regulator CckA
MIRNKEKNTVLIVEDEALIAEDLKLSLQELGFKIVRTVPSAAEALSFLENSSPPDVIIMDIMLEGEMNGIELSHKINALYDIPIVYCSAYNDFETIDQAVLSNPYGYILKPIEERELRATIKIALYKKEMEVKLQKSEERWQFALEGSGDAIWDWNIPANTVQLSEKWKEIIGTDELCSTFREWKEKIHPNDWESVWQNIQQYMKGQTDLFISEYRVISSAGAVVWILNRAKIIQRDTQGNPLRMLGTISDISNRKNIEKHIIESEKKYRHLVETINEGIAIVDEKENFTFVNKAAADIFGMQKKMLLNCNLSDFVGVKEMPLILEQTKLRKQNKESDYELTITNAKKQVRILRVKAKALFENGKFLGSFGVISDITEKKKYEAEMIKQARLESLGILAGGIAHDFNNLLTAILSNIEFAKLNFKNHHILETTLAESVRAIKQAKSLTNQLLTFAKGGEPIIKKVDLRTVLKETADFVLRGSNVKPEIVIKKNIRYILADEGQLQQVLNNLLINARQAMPHGGVIRISAQNDDSSTQPAVKIVIEDDGVGIPKEVAAHVFDPFYTTKEEGTGLGLSTTYSIIKKHHGEIYLESEPNKGTKISLLLPATEETDSKIETKKTVLKKNAYRILVLDDNEMILRVTKEMLSQFGHEVITVTGGSQALQISKQARAENAPFDLYILDLTIPNDIGGKEVVQKLLEENSHTKAIVSSGYSADPIISRYRDYGFSGAISKPYQLEDILRVIAETMEIT